MFLPVSIILIMDSYFWEFPCFVFNLPNKHTLPKEFILLGISVFRYIMRSILGDKETENCSRLYALTDPVGGDGSPREEFPVQIFSCSFPEQVAKIIDWCAPSPRSPI